MARDSEQIAEANQREERARFMREYVIAFVRSGVGISPTIPADDVETIMAQTARKAWDAIEAEAAK
jgi:hypothetical protein